MHAMQPQRCAIDAWPTTADGRFDAMHARIDAHERPSMGREAIAHACCSASMRRIAHASMRDACDAHRIDIASMSMQMHA
jgi:hypothetical protein